MPDPTKKTTTKTKRDLSTPLASSKFDTADYNKDGSVSPREQKRYNKVQKLKQKGKESLSDRSSRRKKTASAIGSAVGGALTIAQQAIKTYKDAKKDK
jgi:hypothetical protein|tara:strand:+ start:3694 stop:3987 length:294 start_codon:yes stop_codon:yes gene_type:complete